MSGNLLKRQFLLVMLSFVTIIVFPQTFIEQTGISLPGVGMLHSSAKWGDYDNDGDLDILIIGAKSSNLYISKIYRNNGDNTFSEQNSILFSGIAQGSGDWGDYDGDGDLDILLSGLTSSGFVTKIYRNNGNNSFTNQTGIALMGVNLGSAAWGDYDNDGDLDILLTGQNSSEQFISKIYQNNSNNSFSEQNGINLKGVAFSSVAWGDYDNDGYLDIILTGETDLSGFSYVTKIYRNNGNNSFIEQPSPVQANVYTHSPAWGDYDNDGDLDILLTVNQTLKIFQNNGLNNFTEQTGIIFPYINYYGSATWGDYDNDGNLDILLTGGGITKIFRNIGNNNFTEQTGIALTGLSNGSAAWGDYDNDGDLDILLTGETGIESVSKVYRNETSAHNTKPTTPSNLQTIIKDGVVTFTWNLSSDTESLQNGLSYNLYIYESGKSYYECPPNAFKQSDLLNGRSLTVRRGNIQWSQSGYVIKDLPPDKTYYWSVQAVDAGFLGGSFSNEQSFVMPISRPVSQANSIVLTNIQEGQVNVTWANGGGMKRVVFIKASATGTADPIDNTTYNSGDLTPGGWKCVYNGTANFVLLTGILKNTIYSLQVCEYNGEAGSEKYLNSAVYQNPASLNTIFTDQPGISLSGVSSGSSAWGDYDNDGYLDILLTGSGIAKIYRNNGNNTFIEQTDIVFDGIQNSSAAWGDYDNDGDLDILLTGYTGTALYGSISKIYRNNGNNSFTKQTGIALAGVMYGSSGWGDYDEDGDLDIILTGYTDSGINSKIYRNNGDNSFTEQTSILITGISNGSVAWGDYDNDGDLDILMTGATAGDQTFDPFSNPSSKIYRNNGNNSFSEQSQIALTAVLNSSAVWGDFDNDSDLDILLTGDTGSGFVTKIYRNNGNNSFSELTGIALPGVTKGAAEWGDYNNDGDLDILLSGDNGSSYLSKIYNNDGNNTFTELSGTAISGVGNSSIDWGDYDRDGDLDILLSGNSITGEVSKIYRNEIQNPNIKPSIPEGLKSYWYNNSIVFKWDLSSDNTTPDKAINYNLRIGTTPGGNEVRSGTAIQSGELLITDINNHLLDTSVTLHLPLNKYYWSVQSIDKGGMSSDFAPEQTTPLDSIQAKDLQAYIRPSNSLLIRWKNGNGLHRIMFGRLLSQTGSAKPVDGTSYHAEPFFGMGDKIGTTGWYCLFNGTADSTLIYGIDKGFSYEIQVIEYIEINGQPYYFRTTGNANPGIFSTSLFSEQTEIVLPTVDIGTVIWGDYDNDGDLDILLTGSYIAKIYRNNGNNKFEEQTGITLVGIYYGDAAWGDYNNDGYLDLILAGGSTSGPVTKIYKNNGDNSFTEQTNIILTQISQGFTVWGDYDNDGNLDILLNGQTSPYNYISKIYRNNGDNTFTEQTGINLPNIFGQPTWGDYDNDGYMDIIYSGYSKIYHNNGNNTFTEQPNILIGAPPGTSTWGDCDNDGYLDVLVTGHYFSSIGSKIYHNNGDNTFTAKSGIGIPLVSASAISWGDYDNDGVLDILLNGSNGTNQFISKIYRNNRNNNFTEVNSISYSGVSMKGSASWGDYDNDGDLDIIIGTKVFRNNTIMKAGNYPGNRRPEAPANLSFVTGPKGVKLSWSPVKTDETNYKAMTYNIMAGSTKETVNVYPPQSNSVTGYRNIVEIGNALTDTTFFLKNLTSGTYFWNVQAVDQGYRGGAWSQSGSFTIKSTQAFFTFDTVCNELPTHFIDQSTSFSEITNWKWDFGDGNTSTEKNPSHLFATPGEHPVKLIAISADYSDTLVQTVTVLPKPTASFFVDPVCHGKSSVIVNSSSTNDLTISSWTWDYGDEQSFSGQNTPAHFYAQPGSYKTKLTINASNGCSDTLTRFSVVGEYPVVILSADGPVEFCSGGKVNLSVGNKTNYSYQWNLNELPLTDAKAFSLLVNTSGSYSVKVTNTVANCLSSSPNQEVSVVEKPAAPVIVYNGTTTDFCPSEESITITLDQPTSAYSYQWKRNGVPIDNETGSAYTGEKKAGIYTASASVKGCSTESNEITLTAKQAYPKPDIYIRGPVVWYMAASENKAAGYTWYRDNNIISGANKYLYVANQTLGTYKVAITNASGCTTISDEVTIPTNKSGMTDFNIPAEYMVAGDNDAFTDVNIYPNPGNGLFFVEMDNQQRGDILFSVYGYDGKELFRIKSVKDSDFHKETINLTGQPNGNYLIKIDLNNISTVKKIILE